MRGFWKPKPGSIMPDGSIVLACPPRAAVTLATSGEVTLTLARAAIAMRFGWQVAAIIRDEYVVMRRAPRIGVFEGNPTPPSPVWRENEWIS